MRLPDRARCSKRLFSDRYLGNNVPTPRGNQPTRRSGRRRRHRVGREYGMSGRGRSVLSVDEAIRRRRSVRAFLPDEVPEAILRSALELAQLAPSNCNAQPWTPHVVSGEALVRLRADLIDAGMREERSNPDWPLDGQYSGVHRECQIDAAVHLYGAMGVGRRDFVARKLAHVRNFAFFDAPHAIFIFMSERFDTRRRPTSVCTRRL